MDPHLREYFDERLDQVVGQLPPSVQRLLREVPLVIEDHPSPDTMRKLGVTRRDGLCGLYTGIPLTQRQVHQSGVLSDVIHVFREGVLAMSRRPDGAVDDAELRRQIRITVMHELGHHHGLNEDDLQSLGY